MFRKILIGSLLLGLIGILVLGAVNRTMARADAGDGIGRSRGVTNLDEVSSNVYKSDQSENELSNDNLEESGCQGNGSSQGKGNKQGEQGIVQGNGTGQGKGDGQGNGQSNGSGQGNGNGKSQGTGNGQGRGNGQGNGYRGGNELDETKAIEWLILEGKISSIDETSLVILATNGESVEIADRPWRYAQDQGFFPSLEDHVTIEAFIDEYGSLEVASIKDLTNDQNLILRDENGRPMWAGR